MRKNHIVTVGIAAIITLAGVVIVGGTSGSNLVAQEATPIIPGGMVGDPVLPTETFENVPGIPGIQLQATAPAGDAAFTVSEITTYIQENPHRFSVSPSSELIIEHVEFLPANLAAQRIGREVPRLGTAMVCVVTLRGDFAGRGPMGSKSGIVHSSQMIFDASNGNLLMMSVGE